MIKNIKTSICGFFMALADSVPGVSGGTVALLAGEYDDFIGSFGDVVSKDKNRRRKALLFLLRLGFGWLIGMGLAVTLLAELFHTQIYAVSSLFLGLVAASVPLVVWEEKGTLKAFRLLHILPFLTGVCAVVALSLFHFSVSTETLTLTSALYVLISGALAISAMVLPGISGSTLLLAFGLYVPIITGLKQILSFDFSPFPLLLLFGIGVLIGIFCSFRGIHWLLKRHRTGTLSAIIGLMVGSLFAVVRGPTTLEPPLPPLNPGNSSIWFLLLGIMIVAVFSFGKILLQKRRNRHGMDYTT